VFDQFSELVSDASGWAYAIVFLVAYLDALIPLVPSETTVITAGVVAAGGHLSLTLVVATAAAGAFLGDNSAYLVGHRFGSRVSDRYFRSEKSRKRIEWAERQLEERGGELIVVARFIPGGRTAVTLSAGTLHYAWPRFAVFDAAAALLWALYSALLGYFGGRVFENAAFGLLLALGTALALAGGIELVRWLLKRRRMRTAVEREEPSAAHVGDGDA
jgi:membrane protein DedA with SNARE-associated domain